MEKIQDCRVRLRLLFERRRVLSKQQRWEGLDRCWFLLRSELSTVSDLARDITRAFHLQSTCPEGLLLSMDGFVLPPFESSDLFRDNDLLRVRKNKGSNKIATQLHEDEEVKVQVENGEGNFEEQPHPTCSPILAIAHFEKESGGSLLDEEDGLVEKLEEPHASCNSPVKKALKKMKRKKKDLSPSSSKRRKSNDSENPTSFCEIRQAVTVENDLCRSSEDNTRNIQEDNKPCNTCFPGKAAQDSEFNGTKEDEHISSKKRRKKSRQTNDQAMVVEDIETITQAEVSHHNGDDLRNRPNGVRKSPDDDDINLKSGDEGNNIPTGIVESVSTVKRQEYLQEQRTESEPQANGEVKKVPSRSARRKKAKRRWLREAKLSTSRVEECQILNNHKNSARCSDTVDVMVPSAGNTEDKIIPIVVRPGHIRFEHSDEDFVEANEGLHSKNTSYFVSTRAIEWSGPLDKKKGQKWGRMSTSSTWNNEKIPQNESKGNGESETIIQPEDFEKLCHLTGSPKVGDVLAYRLVELSSTWCPEVSSFRVGQVTSYDPDTTQCTLVPVPGYAIPLEKAAESSEMLPEQSVYNDDGSVEIEFTSLVDVRLLEGAKSGVASTTSCTNVSIQAEPSNLVNSGGEEMNRNSSEAPLEKKEANGLETWEDIQRALEKKKAELQQQNGADMQEKNNPPAKPSWSYRALRGSAMGPTISLLRANNAL